MNLEQTLATNLRRIRHSRGLSQEELAGRTGLSERHIGSIERGKTSASVKVIDRIADVLEVEAWKLFVPPASQDADPRD